MRSRLTFFSSSLLLLVVGCGGEKNESAEGSSGSSGAVMTDPGTDSVSSSPSETAEPTTAEGTTTTSATDTNDSITTATTTSAGDPTATSIEPTSNPVTSESASDTLTATAEPPPGPFAACNALCEQMFGCGLNQDVPGCAAECEGEFGGVTQMCVDAFELNAECLVGLECEALKAGLESPTRGPCGESGLAVSRACGSKSCGEGGGGGPDQCQWERDCEGEPLKLMVCDQMTCVCTLGGQPAGSCPAEGVCEEDGSLEQKFVECCGF